MQTLPWIKNQKGIKERYSTYTRCSMLVQLGKVWNFKGFLDQKIPSEMQTVSISHILKKIDIL